MLSDLDLIFKVQDGDESAFSELMRRHYRGVVNYIYKFTHSVENSEDLAQEVFIRVYRSIDRYRPEAKFTTWLYKIATNVSITAVRYSNREKNVSLDEMEESNQQTGDEKIFSASDFTFRREISALIFEALETLPEKEKIAIVLCKYEEMPYIEVAEVIGCSVGAVKAYVYRGRMKLIEKLKPHLRKDKAHGL